MYKRFMALWAMLRAMFGELGDEVEFWAGALDKYTEERLGGGDGWVRAAQTQAVLTVVVLGIVLLIGTLIYSQIDSALPAPSNSKLANASTNVTNTFADTMDLAPVIMIVLIAGVVLAVVQRFR